MGMFTKFKKSANLDLSLEQTLGTASPPAFLDVDKLTTYLLKYLLFPQMVIIGLKVLIYPFRL